MTDPISPAEAAAADAIDANLNADLLSGVPTGTTELTDAQKIERVKELEQQLHDLQEGKAHAAGLTIPHGQRPVPAAAVHQATDKPVVHAGNVTPAVAPQGVVEVAVSPSAKLAQLQATGKATPPKRKYAYQRHK